jgi:hypothetical protein
MTCHPAPLPRPEPPSPTAINPFLDLADRQISAPRQARQRAVEKRAARQAAEREQLAAAWRQWGEERREALRAAFRKDADRLFEFLEAMRLQDGAALVSLVEAGPWRQAAADTRFEVLVVIDTAIVGLRTRCGLSPFDDALPGDRPNVFLYIREVLA